jgi:hypothetical protein
VSRLKALLTGRRRTWAKPSGPAPPGGRRERLLADVLGYPARIPDAPGIPVRAAVAVGDRLRLGLSWEWQQDDLQPDTWATTVETTRPELVLVEVGGDTVPGWGPLDDERLTRLGHWCSDRAVPLVVWVTTASSSPVASAAVVQAATAVFVADPAWVETWRNRSSGYQVDVLRPAAQPRLHHPAAAGQQRESAMMLVGDAGVPSRALAAVVAPALQPMTHDAVDVWQVGRQPAPLPGALDNRLVGTVPYAAAATLPARYRVLVDAGRCEREPPWTVVEAGAAQTPAVTLAAQLADLPANIAPLVAAAEDPKALRSEVVARIAQPELRDREALLLHRAVLDGHTYTHRVASLLASLEITAPVRDRSVSAVVPTNRPHQIGNILQNIARQACADTELVLVLHGLQVSRTEVAARAYDEGIVNLQIIEAGSDLTLGACLNLGLDAADGAYVAKMDDDNFYGRHYLTDLVHAFDYTDAGIVGKWAHYVWLRATGAVILRYFAAEHSYERRVQGGSILLTTDLARRLRFADLPRAVDSDLLDRAIVDGVRIYSADRFNFVSVRGTDRHAHTWTVADSTFMTATGRLVFYGDPREHVDV